MRRVVLSVLLVLLVRPVFCNTKFSKEDIRKLYSDIFVIEVIKYKNKSVFSTPIPNVSEKHILSKFLKDNSSYITYIRSIFIDLSKGLSDPESFMQSQQKLKNQFMEIIKKNTEFMNHIEPMIFNYIISMGNKIDEYQVIQQEILSDQVVDCMAKFFYLNRITPKNKYGGKFCAGLNGIKETITKRNFPMEAFCYNTLFNNIKILLPIHQKEVKKIEKLHLGIKEEERLMRAQGAMYLAISQNPQVRELLKQEYQKRKEYLPFRIPDWE